MVFYTSETTPSPDPQAVPTVNMLDADFPAIELEQNRNYSKSERLRLAIAQYFTEKDGGIQKPNKKRIALTFEVAESTLRRHLKNPTARTLAEHNIKQQYLTPEEEDELADRAIFMDCWNIAPTQEQFYDLVEVVLKAKAHDEGRTAVHIRKGETWKNMDQDKPVIASSRV
ncbi:hypothetical protein FN846DRAFT_659188 [Sphaerosporella brunnea]|uniref:Uncharacterized protein n=1 Tax=Sphaerosporella brunnea TaxID=1250544 RepID=A0A5J5EZ11_9PEZI|nr:hypothetical protein FN846DRAFT_659188 [Sphaerosporella brunnea]